VFEKICPGEEYLPKAPNPEDIIYDDGETVGEKETGFEPSANIATTAESEGENSLGVDSTTDTADAQVDPAAADSTSATTEDDTQH